ncbi:MAG TPA: four helix bundle protein [Casimicrobiaceae bacterium]
MSTFSYKDLKVWQAAMVLVKDVYELTKHFPASERFGLSQQLQRSAVSIPSNIAEGHARSRTGDYLRFLSIARGSLAETETQLLLALDLGFADASRVSSVSTRADEIGRMLRALERSLSRRY